MFVTRLRVWIFFFDILRVFWEWRSQSVPVASCSQGPRGSVGTCMEELAGPGATAGGPPGRRSHPWWLTTVVAAACRRCIMQCMSPLQCPEFLRVFACFCGRVLCVASFLPPLECSRVFLVLHQQVEEV